MDCDLYYRSRNTSPKSKVLLLSGIMAVFGVSVSIVIVAAGGGFSGFVQSLFSPPNTSNLWTIGENIHAGSMLNYSLTRIGSHSSLWSGLGEDSSLVDSSVSIKFVEDSNNNNNWQTIIGVINGTAPSMAKNKQATISLSKQQLTNAGPIDQAFKPYSPRDHPHGGGEGRSPIGMPGPKSPWGKPTLATRLAQTRKLKNILCAIVRM